MGGKRLRDTGWSVSALLVTVLWGCAAADASPEGSQDAAPSTVEAPARLVSDSSLVRLVAEIQPAVERSAGISATSPLNVTATDESRLRTYLKTQIREQLSPELASAITASYARLGLVPDSLDLRGFMLALLEEQVVGYYDPATDTLFVHERIGIEQLKPVLAHELVHALQDQRLALDSLRHSLIERNDASSAAQAALEGHAMYGMMEWQFSSMTGSPADLTVLPDLGATLANIDLAALGDFASVKILASAPRIVREAVLFPYVGGLVFVQRAWKERQDRPLPFGEHLPRSTEQVLHIDRWLAGDEPVRIDFASNRLAGWEIVHTWDLGELETRIFLEEHTGDPALAEMAAAGWDGDAYRLLRSDAGEALVWISVWDTETDADEFAAAAAEAYKQRYDGSERRPRIERGSESGRAVVRVFDVPPGSIATRIMGEIEVEERP